MTLQIRANLRLEEEDEAEEQPAYHDITNPGKPQTRVRQIVKTLKVP